MPPPSARCASPRGGRSGPTSGSSRGGERAFVAAAAPTGRTAVVVRFRVSGVGRYQEVLDGLDYRADSQELIPHEAVTEWIYRQARALLHERAAGS
jgi:hypothetical protein